MVYLDDDGNPIGPVYLDDTGEDAESSAPTATPFIPSSSPKSYEPERGFWGSLWDDVNQPLKVDALGVDMRYDPSQSTEDPGRPLPPWMAALSPAGWLAGKVGGRNMSAYVRGAVEGLGQGAAGLTSPVSLATATATPLRGVQGGTRVLQGLGAALGAVGVVGGAKQIGEGVGEDDWGKVALGTAQVAGGAGGFLPVTPKTSARVAAARMSDLLKSTYENADVAAPRLAPPKVRTTPQSSVTRAPLTLPDQPVAISPRVLSALTNDDAGVDLLDGQGIQVTPDLGTMRPETEAFSSRLQEAQRTLDLPERVRARQAREAIGETPDMTRYQHQVTDDAFRAVRQTLETGGQVTRTKAGAEVATLPDGRRAISMVAPNGEPLGGVFIDPDGTVSDLAAIKPGTPAAGRLLLSLGEAGGHFPGLESMSRYTRTVVNNLAASVGLSFDDAVRMDIGDILSLRKNKHQIRWGGYDSRGYAVHAGDSAGAGGARGTVAGEAGRGIGRPLGPAGPIQVPEQFREQSPESGRFWSADDAGEPVPGSTAGYGEPRTPEPQPQPGAGVLGPGAGRVGRGGVDAGADTGLPPSGTPNQVDAASAGRAGTPDYAGLAEEFGADAPEPRTWNRARMLPVLTNIERIPGVGPNLRRAIEHYRTAGDRLSGQYRATLAKAEQAAGGLTDADKQTIIAGFSANEIGMLPARLQPVARTIQSLLRDARQRMVARGLKVGDLGENYFPAESQESGMFDFERSARTGGTRPDDPTQGNVDYSRTADLENLHQDWSTLERYLVEVPTRKIAVAEAFGPDLEYANRAIDQIKDPNAKSYAQTALARILGNERMDETGRILGKLRRARAFHDLPLTGLTQFTQVAPLAGKVGVRNTMSGILSTIRDRQGATTRAMESGALAPNMSGEVLSSLTGKKSGLYGIAWADKTMRTVASEAARSLVDDIKKRGDSAAAESLGIDLDNLTPDSYHRAAKQIVDQTQYRTEAENLPLWASSPIGKTVTQYLPFAYRHTKFLMDMVGSKQLGGRSRIANLSSYLAAAAVAGELTEDLRNLIKGYDAEDPESWRDVLGSRRIKVSDAETLAMRLAQSTLKGSGGLGVLQAVAEKVTSRKPAEALAGPVGGGLIRLADSASGGDIGRLGATVAAETLPLYGSQVAGEIQAGNDEEKLPTKPGYVGKLRDRLQGRDPSVRSQLDRVKDLRNTLSQQKKALDAKYPKSTSMSATLTAVEKAGKVQQQLDRLGYIERVLDAMAHTPPDKTQARKVLREAKRAGIKLNLETILKGHEALGGSEGEE